MREKVDEFFEVIVNVCKELEKQYGPYIPFDAIYLVFAKLNTAPNTKGLSKKEKQTLYKVQKQLDNLLESTRQMIVQQAIALDYKGVTVSLIEKTFKEVLINTK